MINTFDNLCPKGSTYTLFSFDLERVLSYLKHDNIDSVAQYERKISFEGGAEAVISYYVGQNGYMEIVFEVQNNSQGKTNKKNNKNNKNNKINDIMNAISQDVAYLSKHIRLKGIEFQISKDRYNFKKECFRYYQKEGKAMCQRLSGKTIAYGSYTYIFKDNIIIEQKDKREKKRKPMYYYHKAKRIYSPYGKEDIGNDEVNNFYSMLKHNRHQLFPHDEKNPFEDFQVVINKQKARLRVYQSIANKLSLSLKKDLIGGWYYIPFCNSDSIDNDKLTIHNLKKQGENAIQFPPK